MKHWNEHLTGASTGAGGKRRALVKPCVSRSGGESRAGRGSPRGRLGTRRSRSSHAEVHHDRIACLSFGILVLLVVEVGDILASLAYFAIRTSSPSAHARPTV